LHSTGSDTTELFEPPFSGPLYGPGEPLDLNKFYLIIPDSIGHGKSSKRSDGLRTHFPHYGYNDMVTAQYRLVIEKLGVAHLRTRQKGLNTISTKTRVHYQHEKHSQ
jgi:homoserine O-acetyltransferase/O-succinyltransferase